MSKLNISIALPDDNDAKKKGSTEQLVGAPILKRPLVF